MVLIIFEFFRDGLVKDTPAFCPKGIFELAYGREGEEGGSFSSVR